MYLNTSNKSLSSYTTHKKTKSKLSVVNENQCIKNQEKTHQKKQNRYILQEMSMNCSPRLVPGTCNTHRNRQQDSISHQIKKQGYNSNQSSPMKIKNKNQHNHKRVFSNIQAIQLDNKPQPTEIKYQRFMSKTSFDFGYVIGRGGFGKVWLVKQKRNGQIYALKQMSKSLVISKKSVPSVMNQKNLLSNLKHPFLVNMIQSFQDREMLYLAMDFLPGGDLRQHIAKKRRFTQQEAKFTIVCIFLGLKYLHTKGIIHRDIKPENIVLDGKGYARVTDLGVARKLRPDNASDTSGTPGYMAPEVLCRQNHGYSVDFFALGVIAYQMMLRCRPYVGRSRKQIRQEVLSRQVQIKKHQIPDNWSLQAADFTNRLIQRKPCQRLGHYSSNEIMEHPWLRGYPFQKISQKLIQAPFIPKKEEIECENNFSSECTQVKELIRQNQVMLRNEQVQKLFDGYESCSSDQDHKQQNK